MLFGYQASDAVTTPAREIARLDRHQPLAPGPKRVRELCPAASECAARKTRIM
jgi:hypothetical protein